MEKIIEAINTSNPALLSLFGTVLTIIVSIYISKSDTSISFARERHEKLIFPLFNALEPVLYQKDYESVLDSAFRIIEDNKFLADGILLSLYYNCSNILDYNSFISLCSYVDKAYDKSCRKLKLKRRPFSYRINRNQYKSNLHLCVLVIAYLFKYIIAILWVGWITLLIFAVVIYTNNPIIEVIYGAIMFLFITAINKYLDLE